MRQSDKYHVAALVYDRARCAFALGYRSRPCLMPINKSVKQNQSRIQRLDGIINVAHSDFSFPCCFATLVILTDYGSHCNRHNFYKSQ